MNCFSYKGLKTQAISFPLGGIGSGCIGLGGAGHLIDRKIFNRPSKGSLNGFSHLAVKPRQRANFWTHGCCTATFRLPTRAA
jgi:non-lysosomal glucosylceramidase